MFIVLQSDVLRGRACRYTGSIYLFSCYVDWWWGADLI